MEKTRLDKLSVFFLLSFIDAPPSFVLNWLEKRGIEVRLDPASMGVIREDERSGSRAGIKAGLEESIRALERRLELFSTRVDALSEMFILTLLVAPVMVFSLGMFMPQVVETSLPVLLAVNAALLFLFRGLHPRVVDYPARYGLLLVPTAAISLASAALLFLGFAVEDIAAGVALASLPFAAAAFRLHRGLGRELRENMEILVKMQQTPGHLFKAVPPEALLKPVLASVSRAVRLTAYLSSIWGIEDPSLLLATYERIYAFHKRLTAKAFANASMNLITLLLLGFAGTTVKLILSRLPTEMISQYVQIGSPQAIIGVVDAYMLGATIIYAFGLSILSTGSPLLAPLWLPPAALSLWLGCFFGRGLMGSV